MLVCVVVLFMALPGQPYFIKHVTPNRTVFMVLGN